MPAIITDRRTLFNDGDSITGWSGTTTPTLFTTNPDPVESTGCIGVVVSTATVDCYFTAGSPVNLSSGVLVYVWVLANGVMDTVANGGIQILLGDGTNRVGFHLAGSDKAGFRHQNGSVGWQCLVLDTGNLPTQRTVRAGSFASLNLGAITQIGAVFKTLAKSVGGVQNCYVDTIRYGNNGIQVTGGSVSDPVTFAQIVTEDVSSANNKAHGIIRQLGDGVYGIQGAITFGDLTGSATTYFKDTNAVVTFEERGLLADKYYLQIANNNTSSTIFILGDPATTGSDITKNGINGCTIQVPGSASAKFIASGNFVRSCSLYGSSLIGFREGVLFSDSTSGSLHQVYGCTFSRCGQVDPGRAEFRNNLITGYNTGSLGALLWNVSGSVKYCEFTQNTSSINNPAAIEHRTAGTYTYEGLTFSGNEYDIYNSSGGSVTINASAGSNPATYRNSVGSTTTINNTVIHTVTGLETGSRVVWIRVSDDVELENKLESGGVATYSYNYAGDIDVDVQILSLSSKNKIIRVTLTADDATLPASQTDDLFYYNP